MSRDLTPLPSAAAFFALPQPGPCDTDADAYDWLPPFLLARNTYDGLRSEGMVPSAAFPRNVAPLARVHAGVPALTDASLQTERSVENTVFHVRKPIR